MKIINEIFRQKKLMNLLEETREVNSVIFGDDVIDLIDKKNFKEIPQLTSKNLKLKDLISILKTMEPDNEVQNIFFSIGKNDKFENDELVDILSFRLKHVFPNAKINVVKPILGDQDVSNISDTELPTESKVKSFYDEFKNNDISVIGNYNVLQGGSKQKEKKINSLENEIFQKIFTDENSSDFEDVNINKLNVDIPGSDETDFDTIYEFLNRFEKIAKSDNEYKKNMNTGFRPDIEQIQIALKFLDQNNTDLEVTGSYDFATEEAIEDYQRNNKLEVNGIADKETLDEMLFDLRAKGFDEMDLSKYIKSISDETHVKTSSDLSNTIDTEKEKIKDNVKTALVGAGVVGGAAAGLAGINKLIDSSVNIRKYPSNIVDQFKKIPGVDFNKFKSEVESIGIPVDIAVRQLYSESAFSPDIMYCNRRSSAGAMGIAQFMPTTWPSYGRGGDPCKVSDALPAYVKLMSELVDKFNGRLDLAMAGYNGGPNRSALRDALKNNTPFTDLKGKIPEESYNYTLSILQP